MAKIEADALAKFLTSNLAQIPHEPVKHVSVAEAVECLQSSLHYTTFHDDSDEAIMLWTAWHLIRLAVGADVNGRKFLEWNEEVRKCMRGLDDGKD